MKHSRKRMKADWLADGDSNNNQSLLGRCSVCGKRFKTRAHFDAICHLCLADSEMKPYLNFGVLRGARNGGSGGVGGFGFAN